jgi:Tol biopolymer transport system component
MLYRSCRRWVLLALPALLLLLLAGCDLIDDDDDPPPLTGRIAFFSDDAGPGRDDIYVINADGTGLLRLTDDSRIRNWSPAFSPNGEFIAFRGENTEQFGDIYRIAPNGTGETLLTPDTILIVDMDPAVSPDSTRIAFSSNRDGNFEIYEMDADDGGNVVRLTNNTTDDYAPAYVPDGRIVFVSERDGNPEIYIMNADGGSQTRLTNNAADDLHPAVNPFGTRIAFQSNRTGTVQVFTMNLSGGNVQRVTNLGGSDPSYSPDGNWIAFSSGDIFATRPSGSPIVTIYDAEFSASAPSWGP